MKSPLALPVVFAALGLAAPAMQKRDASQVTLYQGPDYTGASTVLILSNGDSGTCMDLPATIGTFNHQLQSIKLNPFGTGFHCRLFDAPRCPPDNGEQLHRREERASADSPQVHPRKSIVQRDGFTDDPWKKWAPWPGSSAAQTDSQVNPREGNIPRDASASPQDDWKKWHPWEGSSAAQADSSQQHPHESIVPRDAKPQDWKKWAPWNGVSAAQTDSSQEHPHESIVPRDAKPQDWKKWAPWNGVSAAQTDPSQEHSDEKRQPKASRDDEGTNILEKSIPNLNELGLADVASIWCGYSALS